MSENGGSATTSERPRLNLKPRDPEAAKKAEQERLVSGNNPFGAAKPREAVIAARTGKTEEEILKEAVKKERPKLRLNAEQLAERRAAEARIDDVKSQLDISEDAGQRQQLDSELQQCQADLDALLDKFEELALEAAQKGEIQRPSERRQVLLQQGPREGERRGYEGGGGRGGYDGGRGSYESGGGRGGGYSSSFDKRDSGYNRGGDYERRDSGYSRGGYEGGRGGQEPRGQYDRSGRGYEDAPRGSYDRPRGQGSFEDGRAAGGGRGGGSYDDAGRGSYDRAGGRGSYGGRGGGRGYEDAPRSGGSYERNGAGGAGGFSDRPPAGGEQTGSYSRSGGSYDRGGYDRDAAGGGRGGRGPRRDYDTFDLPGMGAGGVDYQSPYTGQDRF